MKRLTPRMQEVLNDIEANLDCEGNWYVQPSVIAKDLGEHDVMPEIRLLVYSGRLYAKRIPRSNGAWQFSLQLAKVAKPKRPTPAWKKYFQFSGQTSMQMVYVLSSMFHGHGGRRHF